MDARDRQAEFGEWWDEFDEDSMTLTVHEWGDDCEPMVFPAVYVVCDLCSGKGKHVNPSIDAHGISMEEFAEDPDFAESYRRGHYDEPCYACGGKRVVPKVDEETLKLTEGGFVLLKELQDLLVDRANFVREVEAERRMGA